MPFRFIPDSRQRGPSSGRGCGKLFELSERRARADNSHGLWRSLVAHLTGGQGVASSNLVSPTKMQNGPPGKGGPFVFTAAARCGRLALFALARVQFAEELHCRDESGVVLGDGLDWLAVRADARSLSVAIY
jgi:hypothetical protein